MLSKAEEQLAAKLDEAVNEALLAGMSQSTLADWFEVYAEAISEGERQRQQFRSCL